MAAGMGRAATLAPNVQRMTWLAHKGVIRSTGQHRWLVRCVMHNAQEATVYFVGPRRVTQAQAWQESIGALQLLRWVYTAAFKAREENAQEQPWVESLDAYGLAVRGLAESLVNAPRMNQSAKILRAVIVPHASKSKIEARDANGDTWRLELTGMPSQALLDSLPSVPVESDGKVWTLHYRQDTAYITGWPVAASQAMIDNLANKAAFTIATASSLTVNGAALLSESAKGAVTGKLVSATKFAAARTLYNTDVFNLAYRVQLTSS